MSADLWALVSEDEHKEGAYYKIVDDKEQSIRNTEYQQIQKEISTSEEIRQQEAKAIAKDMAQMTAAPPAGKDWQSIANRWGLNIALAGCAGFGLWMAYKHTFAEA